MLLRTPSTLLISYSLVPGVSFDLLERLFKLDPPQTSHSACIWTTVQVFDKCARQHCSAELLSEQCYENSWITGYKPLKTPHYRDLVVYTQEG